jgi:IclR family transcriptional regulator, pca regulon regulatory protein
VRLSGRRFLPTPMIARLGDVSAQGELWENAAPILSRVAAATGEASSLSVLEGDSIVYMARATGRHVLAVSVNIGSRLPAPYTSMGRVLLAGSSARLQASMLSRLPSPPTPNAAASATRLGTILTEVSAQGYALVDEELEPGLLALAVPVHGPDRAIIAALNISSTPGRTTCAKMKEDWLPVLLSAAAEMTTCFAALAARGIVRHQ